MNSEKQRDLFDLATDFDGVSVEFGRAIDLIEIFDECIENEIIFLKEKSDCPYTKNFIARYSRLSSILGAFEIFAATGLKNMNELIQEGYQIHQADRAKKVQA